MGSTHLQVKNLELIETAICGKFFLNLCNFSESPDMVKLLFTVGTPSNGNLVFFFCLEKWLSKRKCLKFIYPGILRGIGGEVKTKNFPQAYVLKQYVFTSKKLCHCAPP